MRGDAFADASPTRGIATCNPHGFVGNRLIEAVLAGGGGGKGEAPRAATPGLARGLLEGRAPRGKNILCPPALPPPGDHQPGIHGASLLTRGVAAAAVPGVK